jgi:hypothetical protein
VIEGCLPRLNSDSSFPEQLTSAITNAWARRPRQCGHFQYDGDQDRLGFPQQLCQAGHVTTLASLSEQCDRLPYAEHQVIGDGILIVIMHRRLVWRVLQAKISAGVRARRGYVFPHVASEARHKLH